MTDNQTNKHVDSLLLTGWIPDYSTASATGKGRLPGCATGGKRGRRRRRRIIVEGTVEADTPGTGQWEDELWEGEGGGGGVEGGIGGFQPSW